MDQVSWRWRCGRRRWGRQPASECWPVAVAEAGRRVGGVGLLGSQPPNPRPRQQRTACRHCVSSRRVVDVVCAAYVRSERCGAAWYGTLRFRPSGRCFRIHLRILYLTLSVLMVSVSCMLDMAFLVLSQHIHAHIPHRRVWMNITHHSSSLHAHAMHPAAYRPVPCHTAAPACFSSRHGIYSSTASRVAAFISSQPALITPSAPCQHPRADQRACPCARPRRPPSAPPSAAVASDGCPRRSPRGAVR